MNYSRYREKKIKKIGFLDIETHGFGFNANESFMVSWVLKIVNTKTHKSKLWYDIIDKKDLKYWNRKMKNNKRLQKIQPYDDIILESLVDAMKECDLIVGHYSNYFDVPFIRTRCHFLKIPFIKHSDKIRFADTWVMARFKHKFKRNSLDNISRSLGVAGKKTVFDVYKWVRACRYGDKKELDEVLHHNILDVQITERVFNKFESSSPIPTRYY